MAEIRSSIEIALEKADRLGRASNEEFQTEQWLDQGRRLSVQFLAEEDTAFRKMFEGVDAAGLPTITKGALEVLLRNVVLPRESDAWDEIGKALNGIIELKGRSASQAVSQMEQTLQSFEQSRQHYLEQLRAQFQGKLGGVQQAVAQQYGDQVAQTIEVDALPEFQKEWSRISSEIMGQFEQQLTQLKQYLEDLP